MGRTWSDAKAYCMSLGGELLPDLQAAQIDMEHAIHMRMCTTSEIPFWRDGTTGMCSTTYVFTNNTSHAAFFGLSI